MTTSRHDPADAPGPHDEFWGEQTEWTPQRPPSVERAGTGATLGRWWNALLGGGAVAGRVHGRPTTPSSPSGDPDQLVDGAPTADRRDGRAPFSDTQNHERQDHDRRDHDGDDGDDLWDHVDGGAWELEPEPQPTRHPGVDPLLARLGGLAVIVTLAAPLVVGFASSGSESQAADSMLATISTTPTSEFADPTTTGAAAELAPAATTGGRTPATPAGSALDLAAMASPETTPSDAGDAESGAETSSAAVAASLEDAPSSEPAETASKATTSACGGRYELAAGDYWIRLADAAGVSLSELLTVNDSSIDTVLVPGRSICLPVGAATPSPPAPAPTAPARTAPARTAPSPSATPTRPTTTAAPTPPTTAPSRPAAVSQSEAAAIIRDVWPDDLEERALEIAWRESNHRSNVNNYCCYGLFQIHWTAHRSWLATIGVTSVSQLYDPVINANAAYTLYQRAGGFGPWGG